MAENENAFEYMDDCIHLHACRRYAQKVKKECGKKIARGCNEECSAYQQSHRKKVIGYIEFFLQDLEDGVCYADEFDTSVFRDIY